MLNVPHVFEPVIEVSPHILEVGEVPVGECVGAKIHITNYDGCDLHVSDIRLSDSTDMEFDLCEVPDELPVLVPSESSVDVEIKFHPIRKGEASGSVEVVSDDPIRPLETVILHAQGV